MIFYASENTLVKYAQKNIPTKHFDNKSNTLYPIFFVISPIM